MIMTSVDAGTIGSKCGNVSGNAMFFEGGARTLETVDLDMRAGGTISFYLHMGNDLDLFCDRPELHEDVLLEYRAMGSAVWVIIHEFLAAVQSDYQNKTLPQLYTSSVPAGAQTAATRFRIRQRHWYSAGNGYDMWAVDEVHIVATGTGPECAVCLQVLACLVAIGSP